MDYLVAKYLHLLGLAVWIGMIPYEAFASKRIVRTRDQRARYRYLYFANKLRFCQEYPSIVLVFGTGLWLASIHGFAELLQQEWFLWKLALLGLLVFAEVYLTYDGVMMERECKKAAEAGELADVAKEPVFPMILGTLAIVWFLGVLFCAIFKYWVWVGVVAALVVLGPPFIIELLYYKRWRAGRYIDSGEQMKAASR